MPALGRGVVGTARPTPRWTETAGFLYNVVRGLVLDQELLDAMPVEHSTTEQFDEQRAELVRVLADSCRDRRRVGDTIRLRGDGLVQLGELVEVEAEHRCRVAADDRVELVVGTSSNCVARDLLRRRARCPRGAGSRCPT